MKIYLGLITTVALSLVACSGGETTAPAATDAAASTAQMAPAAEVLDNATASAETMSTTEVPADCTTEINSDDMMKFDQKEITIKSSCTQYKITLHHTGKMPVSAMGHNVVISKTADKDGILADAASAGEKENYVKPGDERIIAHTKLIGGGQSDSITFDVAKLNKDEAYEFFCSFPGHYALMNGKITLAN